jgi:hypothetical protein
MSGGTGGKCRGSDDPELTSGRRKSPVGDVSELQARPWLKGKKAGVKLTTEAGVQLKTWHRSADDLCGAVQLPGHPLGCGRA